MYEIKKIFNKCETKKASYKIGISAKRYAKIEKILREK